MVFPWAVHSRFEHSLGVHCLAGQAVHLLQNHQRLELDIDWFDVRAVKLAATNEGLKTLVKLSLFGVADLLPPTGSQSCSMPLRCFVCHEQMAARMIDHIVDEHHVDVDPETIKRVKSGFKGI
ncbi:hypothetical protein Ancab_005497 [Ancistrocladus abbreviatus]